MPKQTKKNQEAFIEEVKALLDYESDLSQTLKSKQIGIYEAKDLIYSNVVERLNLAKANLLAFFSTPPMSSQYEATMFIEFDLNGKHILEIKFTVKVNDYEDNYFHSFRLFSEKTWKQMQKEAVNQIKISDKHFARYLATPIVAFYSY